MIDWQAWMLVLVSLILVPSVAWLVKEVLTLRKDMVRLMVRMDGRDKDCERHQEWNSALQKTLERTDRNVVRLCTKADAEYETA